MGPSKKPTKDEQAWMNFLTEFGCVACHLDGNLGEPCAVHHMVYGGRRLGHRFTIGLCDPGHHQNGQARGMISIHPFKARFVAKYGTEQSLWEFLRQRYNQ